MTFSFHIHEIEFDSSKFGAESNLKIPLNHITILVGPNNSGKSQVLKDVEYLCKNNKQTGSKLLKDIVFALPETDEEINELLTFFQTEKPQNSRDRENEIYLTSLDFKEGGQKIDALIDQREYFHRLKQRKISGIVPEISKLFTIKLDGRTRFNLVRSTDIGNLNDPSNFLASLYRKDKQREELRKIIHDEFNSFCYIDATRGSLQIKMNPKKISSIEERSLGEDMIDFFQKSTPIEEMGDGVQAFTGILLAVSSLEHRILLIDEPEAFLHPPQANHLGKYLTQFANRRTGSLITSTHSSDFLMGCIEESSKISIIRLTYENEVGTIKQLDSKEIKDIIEDPILRSTETLNALFHKSAVVVESDGDRVFYSEINRKLNEKSKGLEDPIFLNSHGKNDIHRIVRKLRKIGIPAVCVYDLDIVKVQQNQWEEILKSMNIPDAEISKLELDRQFLLEEITKIKEKDKPDPFKKIGIPGLEKELREKAYQTIDKLAKYGIFVIDIGELEEWLKSFEVGRGDKGKWLREMLTKLDDKKSYKINAEEDVWKFIIKIRKWVINQNRLGM